MVIHRAALAYFLDHYWTCDTYDLMHGFGLTERQVIEMMRALHEWAEQRQLRDYRDHVFTAGQVWLKEHPETPK